MIILTVEPGSPQNKRLSLLASSTAAESILQLGQPAYPGTE